MTLLSGGMIAQMLPWLATFLLARLYSPQEFGYLAIFTTLSAAAAIAATGRYEMAIPLPPDESDADSLVLVAAGISLCVSSVLSLVLFCLPSLVPGISQWHEARYTLPLAVFAIALYQILTYRFLRKGLYRQISVTRFVQAGSTVLISILAGYLAYQGGLVLGYVSGWAIGALLYVLLTLRRHPFNLRRAAAGMKQNASRFYHHALYGAIPALLDSVSIFSIIFIISHHYGSDYAGQYNLSRQFAYGPASLIAGAIGQVLFRESSQRLMTQQEDISLFRTISRYLLYAALLYTPLLIVASPDLFPLLFGQAWKTAGLLTAILAVSYGIRLIVSTLSSFLLAHRALRINGAWQAGYFIIINSLYFFHPETALDFFICLAVVDLVLYGLYFMLIRHVVYKRPFTEASI